MDYFELFDIPVQLKVDAAGLHQKYIALSRQYHPDYFVKDGHEKLAEMQEITATLNKAYQTFRDPDATIKYVLQLKGLLEEEEKYQLPSGFLMEVMEINEQVMEMDGGFGMTDGGPGQMSPDNSEYPGQPEVNMQQAAIQQLSSAIHHLHTEIYEPVKETIEHYQEGITSEEALLQVKEYYYKKKYLDRIRLELAGKM